MKTLCFWLGLLLSQIVTTQAASLSLAEAEQRLLRDNPDIYALNERIMALKEVPSQLATLADPRLDIKILNLPMDSFSFTQENMTQLQIGIAQAIPFPGKLSLKAAQAEDRVLSNIANRDDITLKLLQQLRLAWWELFFVQKALQIVDNNLNLLRNLIKISQAKYKTGKGLQQDVLLAQLELSHLLDKELTLKNRQQQSIARLNALIADTSFNNKLKTEQKAPKLKEKLPKISDLYAYALQKHPIVIALKARILAAQTGIELAHKDYYPDFTLSATYGVRQGNNPISQQSRNDLASIMLSMNLPFYTSDKQDKQLSQRKHEKKEQELQLKNSQFKIKSLLQSSYDNWHIRKQQLSLYKQGILAQAKQTTASMLAGYRVNKVDFLNLVRAQLAEFNNQIQYWRLYSQIAQAEADLSYAIGVQFIEKEFSDVKD